MAAAAKSKVNTSLMSNPPKGKGTAAKGTAAKGAAKPASTQTKSKRKYTRNPGSSALLSTIIASFAGAGVINLFDFIINYFVPTIPGTVRTGSKFVLGVAALWYGNKTPFVGKYAPVVGSSLLLAGSLDLWGNYVMPRLTQWLGVATPVVVAQKQITTETGELGVEYELSDGNYIQMIPEGSGGGYTASLEPTGKRGFVY